jgi:hypothetical protein
VILTYLQQTSVIPPDNLKAWGVFGAIGAAVWAAVFLRAARQKR